MRKLITIGMAVAMLAVPTAAMADAPDGTYTIDPKVSADASTIGSQSSQITQNGQFVSGKFTGTPDWQHQKGSRSDIVQSELAKDGLGSLATP